MTALEISIGKIQKAHCKAAIEDAIRSGRLLRPSRCPVCGKKKRLDAHHSDYSQPLKVLWRCRKCHGAETREINRIARLMVADRRNGIEAREGRARKAASDYILYLANHPQGEQAHAS